MNVQQTASLLRNQINQVLVGCDEAVDFILMSFLVKGHILLEDVPGTGKTTLAKAIAKSCSLSFKRIQFTPDLLPSDLIGLNFYNQSKSEFEFRPGPLFSQLVLADEINRAAPRTQSSLLEAMEEHQISVDGTTYPLVEPFLVLATQNPVENQGTFPLPEAQIDRFLVRLKLGYPSKEKELELYKTHTQRINLELTPILTAEKIIELQQEVQQVKIHPDLLDYIYNIVEKTRQHEKILLGISPRGALACVRSVKAFAAIQGRDFVLPDDIKKCVIPVFAHRIVVSGLSFGSHYQAEKILEQIMDDIRVPSEQFNTKGR